MAAGVESPLVIAWEGDPSIRAIARLHSQFSWPNRFIDTRCLGA